MNQTDARAFVMALNSVQPYVPPMIFQSLLANPMIKVIEAVANGQALNPQMVEGETKAAG